MPEPSPPGPDFETRLQREVDRILADPAFQRSPVQSRLLAYLAEQTIARNRNVSQLAVAVDGLGRPETADQLTESYPRVQISRLRRNLALYYARCQPGEGLAVYVPHGDYQLRLAPPDSAYGEQRARGLPRSPANDVTAAAVPAPPTPVPPARANRLAVSAAIVFALVAIVSLWLAFRPPGAGQTGAPPLEVRIEGPAGDPLLVVAAQLANDIAANSYVVRSVTPEEREDAPGYTMRLQRSQTMAARPVLEVSLFDEANQRLFHEAIPIGEDRAAVLTRLNGALLQIVNPAGTIAGRELAEAGDEPRSDYECVLKTESDRLEGGLRTSLVESCLRRFPESQYRAYWYSRMAFMGYRNQVLSGGVIEARGAPWQNLQQALEADSANPFANYMAAKVNFSRGDCEAARPYFDRTLANGNYSGVLTAASVSEAALCADSLAAEHEAGARIVSLVTAIPDPNPLLHVYMIFATAVVDRPEIARRLLTTPMSEDPQGSMADIVAALKEGLADPAAFERNRDRLQRVVDGFYWEAGQRRNLMDKLSAVAAYRA